MNFVGSPANSFVANNAVPNVTAAQFSNVVATSGGLHEDISKRSKKAPTSKSKKPRKRSPKKQTSKPSISGQDQQGSQVIVHTPLTTDVILGRGAPLTKHPGNVRYREIVADHRAIYATAARTDKLKIAALVVQKFRQEGGRFLEKDGAGGWKDIGDKRATDKTAQTLREGQPLIRLKILELKCAKNADADATAETAAKLAQQDCKTFEQPESHKEAKHQELCTDPRREISTSEAPSVPSVEAETADATTASSSQPPVTENRRDFLQRMSSVDSLLVETSIWDDYQDDKPDNDGDDVSDIALKTKSQTGGFDILRTVEPKNEEVGQTLEADPTIPTLSLLTTPLGEKDNILTTIEEYMEGDFVHGEDDTDDDIASLVTATTAASTSQFADAKSSSSFMSEDEDDDKVITMMPVGDMKQEAREQTVDRRSIMKSLRSRPTSGTNNQADEMTHHPALKNSFDRRAFFKNTKSTNLSETSLEGLNDMLDPIQMWRDSFRRGLPVVGADAENLAQVAQMAASADNIGEKEDASVPNTEPSSVKSEDDDSIDPSSSSEGGFSTTPLLTTHINTEYAGTNECPSTPVYSRAQREEEVKDELFEMASTVTPTSADDSAVTSLFTSMIRATPRPPLRRAVSEQDDRLPHLHSIPSRLNNVVVVERRDHGTDHGNSASKENKAPKRRRRSAFVMGEDAQEYWEPKSSCGLSMDTVHFQTIDNMRRYQSEAAQRSNQQRPQETPRGSKHKKRRSV